MKFAIRTRLTVAYCSVFCVSMMALEASAYFGLGSSINAVVDLELHARLAGVVNFVDGHIKFALPRFQSELASHEALQPELLDIVDVEEGGIFRSPTMREIAMQKRATASPVAWTATAKSEHNRVLPLRVLTERRAIRGREYDLNLATDLTVPAEVRRRFRWLLIVSAPLILVCASVAGYWISGRALAPVSELIRASQTIGAANLAQRVIVPASGDEIQELAITLNRMLTRIEDAFRHVTQFTADASHELRTPLALIRTTAEVALLGPNGNAKSYREALHRILREAEKNTGLLDSLLRLARADSVASTANLHPLNLGKKLTQACERVELLAREKNIVLRVEPIGDEEAVKRPLTIAGDANELLRLCLILLDNAIKYTPEGGTVTAAATRTGETVNLEVLDTGIGIAEDDLPKIFERFFRTDEARTRGGGTGLGLSIAKLIVESHHAKISVTSAPGAGSAFRVAFPAIAATREEEAAADSAVADQV
jgi:heavy metal sensor kinase